MDVFIALLLIFLNHCEFQIILASANMLQAGWRIVGVNLKIVITLLMFTLASQILRVRALVAVIHFECVLSGFDGVLQ